MEGSTNENKHEPCKLNDVQSTGHTTIAVAIMIWCFHMYLPTESTLYLVQNLVSMKSLRQILRLLEY